MKKDKKEKRKKKSSSKENYEAVEEEDETAAEPTPEPVIPVSVVVSMVLLGSWKAKVEWGW